MKKYLTRPVENKLKQFSFSKANENKEKTTLVQVDEMNSLK